jgi:TolA-binding protein
MSKLKFILASMFILSTLATIAQNTLTYTENDSHYRQGLEYYERANYAAAKKEFSDFLKNSPDAEKYYNHDQINAEYYRTMCSLFLDAPEADVEANRFVANHPNNPKAATLFKELGNYYFAQEDYQRSIYYFKKVNSQQLNPSEQAEAAFKLGMSYYKNNELQNAVATFSKAKNLGNEKYSTVSAYYAGSINYKLEQYPAAIADFTQIENHPNYKSEAPIWIANSYYKQSKMDELLKYAAAKTKSNPGEKYTASLAQMVGDIYFQNADYQHANEYYEVFRKQNKAATPADLNYRMGYTFYKLKKYNEATTQLKSIATRNDELGQYASYYLGVCNLNLNNVTEALAAFDAAKRLAFNKEIKEDASFNHAKAQLASGNANAVINELTAFTKEFPKSGYTNEANELLTEAYLSTNNYLAAIKFIEGVKNRSKNMNGIYQRMTYNQGVSEFNADQYDKAIFYLVKSELAPEDSQLKTAATFLKGESFYHQKKFTDALQAYSQIDSPSEYELKSLYSTAYIYYNQKNYDKAAVAFKEYTTKAKGRTGGHYNDAMARLADCYLAQKNYAAAQQTYDVVALSAEADRDYALYQKAQSMVYQGKEAQAKEAYLKIVNDYAASPYADDAAYKLAEIELNLGNTQTAINHLSKLINGKPKSEWVPNALLKRAVAYTNLKGYDAAIVDYRRILNNFPTDETAEGALLGLQDVLSQSGRPEEFATDLAAYKKKNPSASSTETLEYETARNMYYAQSYAKAIPAIQAFLTSYSYSANGLEMKYLLAESYNKTAQKPNALKYYYEVMAASNSQYLARAALRAAELETSLANYPKAINNYRLLAQNSANNRDKLAASVGLMDSYFNNKNYDSTLVFAREVISIGTETPGLPNRAQLMLGKAYLAKNEITRANLEFDTVIKMAKDEYGAEAKYMKAYIWYQNKDYRKCIDECKGLNTDFADYENWRGRGFLLIADSYIALDDLLNAKAVLNSIIDNSEDVQLVNQAKERIVKLK